MNNKLDCTKKLVFWRMKDCTYQRTTNRRTTLLLTPHAVARSFPSPRRILPWDQETRAPFYCPLRIHYSLMLAREQKKLVGHNTDDVQVPVSALATVTWFVIGWTSRMNVHTRLEGLYEVITMGRIMLKTRTMLHLDLHNEIRFSTKQVSSALHASTFSLVFQFWVELHKPQPPTTLIALEGTAI